MEAEIGLRGIVRSEGAFRDQESVLRNGGYIIAADEIRILVGPNVDRLNLFRLGVVNGAIPHKQPGRAINPDVALRDNVMRLGVVGGFIGVDIGIAGVDGNIAGSPCDPPVVAGGARGRDFDRLLFCADLCPGERSRANQTQKR